MDRPGELERPGRAGEESYVTPSKEERRNAGPGRLKPC
jgi:hypothetical protein